MLDRCWNTAQGLLSTVNCVSNTDGVRRERYTQLNSKSFSAAVSHTCEDEDDCVDKTIWVDHVLSVKCDCLRPVWITICSVPLQLTKTLLSPFCAGCCFFRIRVFLSSGLGTFLNCCVLLYLSVDQVALIILSLVHILVVCPFQFLPTAGVCCSLAFISWFGRSPCVTLMPWGKLLVFAEPRIHIYTLQCYQLQRREDQRVTWDPGWTF